MIVAANAIIMIEFAKKEKPLTEWEGLFVRNIIRMRPNRALSTKQEAIIDRIYRRCTGGADKEFHQYVKK